MEDDPIVIALSNVIAAMSSVFMLDPKGRQNLTIFLGMLEGLNRENLPDGPVKDALGRIVGAQRALAAAPRK